MHASLESRAPFLDRDLVEFCRRLPHGYKMRGGQRKFLLKEALRGIVPEFVLGRRKKGFGIPLADWLGSLEPSSTFVAPGLRPSFVKSRWAGFHNKTEDERLFLWAYINLAHLRASA
jgi:asparagine synthase (glutamine-hydrolysing)